MVLVDIINEIFPDSPVSNLVIGNKRSIKNVTLEDLKVFHTSYYVPENMMVLAAGNLRIEEMASYLLTMMGSLERRPTPEHVFTTPHIAINELEKKIPVNQELLIYGGILPEITLDDYPAVEVLEALIFSGVNSRLYRKIVIEKGITDDLYDMIFPLSDCRIWAVFMSLNPGDTDKALNIIREEIGSVLLGEFSESELEDAKKSIIAKLFIDLDAPEDLANFMLTNMLLRNRIITPFEHARDLRDLKRDDVVKMAKRYFIPENLGTISLKPAKGLSKWYIALKFLATKKF
jgi:predicted Zn-dependent peptidase